MHKKIFSCLAAIFAVFMLSYTSSAQKIHPQYIYCKVDFQFSRQVKGWKVNMFVDYESCRYSKDSAGWRTL